MPFERSQTSYDERLRKVALTAPENFLNIDERTVRQIAALDDASAKSISKLEDAGGRLKEDLVKEVDTAKNAAIKEMNDDMDKRIKRVAWPFAILAVLMGVAWAVAPLVRAWVTPDKIIQDMVEKEVTKRLKRSPAPTKNPR